MFRRFAGICVGALFLAVSISHSADAAPARSEAITFAQKMGLGWNLGNTLEATGGVKGTSVRDYETAWGNPVTTKAMIDGIKASGFHSMRIPVA